ncbi:unnamed protein product, partial [Mesorhabditis belari]|uniref:Uncharacterized protein n=1 Tax=Mesorhabditis belari TaxID=2138241 RepID=A0AAF3J4U7_9BILA
MECAIASTTVAVRERAIVSIPNKPANPPAHNIKIPVSCPRCKVHARENRRISSTIKTHVNARNSFMEDVSGIRIVSPPSRNVWLVVHV